MANRDLIDTLRKKGELYAHIEIAKEIRLELGMLDFSELTEDFENLQALGKRIAECSWKGVPEAILPGCINAFSEVDQAMISLRKFDVLRSGNATQERNNHFANFRNGSQRLYSAVIAHLCYSEMLDDQAQRSKSSVTEAEAEIEAMKTKLKAIADTATTSIKEEQGRMKALVASMEDMARQSGVTNQADHFRVLANGYRAAVWGWGAGAVIAGLGLYLYVYYLNIGATGNETPMVLAARFLPRLITVTLLSTALIFCIRNFSAMMHNLIVNRHRQTALKTFKTFVNSTEDDGTRNAVLIQATQAIFAPQPSGYLKNEAEMPQVNQVTEIVRGLAGKDKE